jgi:hypothetical protein
MTSRRSHRQTHVRPRPPSTGRPAAVKVKRPVVPTRLAGHRPAQRNGRLPWIVRLALVVAVLALCTGVLYVGMGGVGIVIGRVGSTVGGFIEGVTATPAPKPSTVAISNAPSLEQPSEPYTSQPNVDLVVTVPSSLIGSPDYRIRVYLALPDQRPTAIQDAALASVPKTVIPVVLEDGVNDFTVTIVGDSGESEPSAVARYVLDSTAPKITITSPLDNAVVNDASVVVIGKTQARTTLLARNDANGSTIAGTAGTDGTFTLSLAIASGVNTIRISGTDPAGNVSETSLTVRRGAGKLTVNLSASVYQIMRSKLPQPVTLDATATNPDGQALADADVTFTLSIPGIPTVTIDGKTDASGNASFTTTIPKGATIGQGSATVLITSAGFGSTEDFTVISIVQ